MSDTLRGALWMLGTIVSFSVMAVAGREAGAQLDTFELMMYRSAVGALIVTAVIAATNRWHELRTNRIATHVWRNIAHFTGQNLWFYAVTLIPLAQVFALEFTTPIWVILLGPLFLGERLTRIKLLCAALGFTGVLIVTQPGSTPLTAGVVTAASAAIFFATTIILTKRLTRSDSIACILFYLTAIQLVLGVTAAGWDLDIAWPEPRLVPHVLAVAIGGLAAHFCFTKALTLAPATVVSPIDFGRLPVIALVGWLLYGEAAGLAVFVGGALIFAGNYLNVWTETRGRPSA